MYSNENESKFHLLKDFLLTLIHPESGRMLQDSFIDTLIMKYFDENVQVDEEAFDAVAGHIYAKYQGSFIEGIEVQEEIKRFLFKNCNC